MALISLTQYETNLPFHLDDSQIEMVMDYVVNNVSVGSEILYSAPHNTGFNKGVIVTQNFGAILGLSTKLISLDISKDGEDYTTVLLNGSVNHFGTIQDPPGTNPPLANSQFEYFRNGNTMEVYLAQQTPAQISTAVASTGVIPGGFPINAQGL
jgi:hypothetical protein